MSDLIIIDPMERDEVLRRLREVAGNDPEDQYVCMKMLDAFIQHPFNSLTTAILIVSAVATTNSVNKYRGSKIAALQKQSVRWIQAIGLETVTKEILLSEAMTSIHALLVLDAIQTPCGITRRRRSRKGPSRRK